MCTPFFMTVGAQLNRGCDRKPHKKRHQNVHFDHATCAGVRDLNNPQCGCRVVRVHTDAHGTVGQACRMCTSTKVVMDAWWRADSCDRSDCTREGARPRRHNVHRMGSMHRAMEVGGTKQKRREHAWRIVSGGHVAMRVGIGCTAQV